MCDFVCLFLEGNSRPCLFVSLFLCDAQIADKILTEQIPASDVKLQPSEVGVVKSMSTTSVPVIDVLRGVAEQKL